MIFGFASKTFSPAQSATSAVNLPSSSTGTTTGMPAARHSSRSSSPKPGAMCTTPVPSAMSTKAPAEHAEGVRRAREEREQRPVAPADQLARRRSVPTRSAPASSFAYFSRAARRRGSRAARPSRRPRTRARARRRARGWTAASRASSSRPTARSAARRPPGSSSKRTVMRRVLALAVAVVEARLEVRDGRLRRPRVGQHARALVEQALVPEPLEGPQHALHVGEVHGLVVVLEVDPAPGARHGLAATARCSGAPRCGSSR